MDFLPEVIKKITPDLEFAISEVQQPRSRFQLEKFVINQHDTTEMQYVQCVNEIQNLYYTIKTISLELQKKEIQIKKLRATGDEVDEIDAQIIELGIEQTRVAGIGAFRELEHLVDMWNSFPVKYTREQIELNQPEYWNKRLTRQAEAQALGTGSVEWAQIDAMRQAGILENIAQPVHQKPQQEIEGSL